MKHELSPGQTAVLVAAAVPMAAAGGIGGWGTYTNIVTEFHRAATALGVVAAGEGVTLILALLMVGLTMLGQAAPTPVRLGLWLAPVVATVTGLVVADDATEAVVYAMTPMAMSASAEGLGLLARRVVIHRTGVDAEAQRRNATTMQRLAVARAIAANHPDKKVRTKADLKAWDLAKRVGVGDTQLGAHLVEVQRDRLGDGADAALASMLATTPDRPPAAPEAPVRHSATEALRPRFSSMDPADAIRVAHDAQPDMPPAELAALLVTYGVIVDAVQVALVLHGQPERITVDRDDADDADDDAPADTGDAPQVTPLALTKKQAVLDAVTALGPAGFTPKDVVDRVKRINRITVQPAYVRTVLSREKKAEQPQGDDHMEGGFL
ncbi:hypothetical protein ACWCWD_06420 [Streptomyces sp. NPDC001493]